MALDDFDTHDSAQAPEPSKAPATAPVANPPVATAPVVAAAVVAVAKKPASAEDEDLFDFPVVEMKFEADGAKRPAATSAPAAANAVATKPVPVASTPTAAGTPATAAAPAAKAATPAAGASAPLAKPAAAKDAPKSASAAAAKSAEKDVAEAAQLVEDIEQVLGSDGKPRKRKRMQGPSPLALAGIGALVLTNVLGLFFIWHTTQSFQTGVQAMNQQLKASLLQQALLQGQPAPSGSAEHGDAGSQQTGRGPARGRLPLEASEKTTLQMAREEIEAGDYTSARQRLSRLLAVADRIEADVREGIEAEAAFLIANTYRKQAEAAAEKRP
jgi:hypothetical protein